MGDINPGSAQGGNSVADYSFYFTTATAATTTGICQGLDADYLIDITLDLSLDPDPKNSG